MDLSYDVVNSLIALQEKDASLDRHSAEMARIPVQIKALRDGVEREKGALDAAKGDIITLEKKKKEREMDLSQKEEAVRKHQKELNQVKTNEQFRALQREIDQAKEEGGALETQILEIMDQLDAARKAEKAAAAELKGVEAKAAAEIAALEARLKELQARFDAEKVVRDGAAAGINPDFLKVYEYIRSRGKPDAVVPVHNESCGACQMRLSPHVIVETTKLKKMVFCESCQRVLYRPEALAAAAAAAAASAQGIDVKETAGGSLPAA